VEAEESVLCEAVSQRHLKQNTSQSIPKWFHFLKSQSASARNWFETRCDKNEWKSLGRAEAGGAHWNNNVSLYGVRFDIALSQGADSFILRQRWGRGEPYRSLPARAHGRRARLLSLYNSITFCAGHTEHDWIIKSLLAAWNRLRERALPIFIAALDHSARLHDDSALSLVAPDLILSLVYVSLFIASVSRLVSLFI
jgi:hypothetical protein